MGHVACTITVHLTCVQDSDSSCTYFLGLGSSLQKGSQFRCVFRKLRNDTTNTLYAAGTNVIYFLYLVLPRKPNVFFVKKNSQTHTHRLSQHFVRGKSFVSMSKIHLCGRWQLVNKRTFDSSGCFGRAPNIPRSLPFWPVLLSITWLKCSQVQRPPGIIARSNCTCYRCCCCSQAYL